MDFRAEGTYLHRIRTLLSRPIKKHKERPLTQAVYFSQQYGISAGSFVRIQHMDGC